MPSTTTQELRRLSDLLREGRWRCEFFAADPIDQVLVDLAPDHRGRPQRLEIFFISDLLHHLDEEDPIPQKGELPLDSLQLFVNLPIEVDPANLLDLSAKSSADEAQVDPGSFLKRGQSQALPRVRKAPAPSVVESRQRGSRPG